MNNLRKYIRTEVEVEIFACAHITAMVFLYGFLRWLMYDSTVSFPVILEQMILGYVISWVQKVLFLQEKSYTERSYRIREILWCLLPGCLTAAAGSLGNWFPEAEGKTSLWFYGIMFCYFILLWLFLKKFYREETEEMNELLNRRKQKKIWREKSD